MLNCLGKNVPRFVEIIAGVKQAIDLRAVTRPFLDHGEVAQIQATHSIDARSKQNQ
jgi:hypothetical protein